MSSSININTSSNNNGGGGVSPEIELEGDWGKALAMIDGVALSSAVLAGAKEGQIRAAKQIVKMVKTNINNGKVPGVFWPSLSPSYKALKEKKGYGSKTYIYTGQYYDSIGITIKPTGVFAGVPRWAKGRVNKEPKSLGRIAKWLERERPLWAPTYKQFGGKAKVGLYVTVAIKKNLLLLSGLSSVKGNIKLR